MNQPTGNHDITDVDDKSDVSSLQCGSIPPNPDYDPARDPSTFSFVPPLEILVEAKVEIPDWLRPDTCEPTTRPALSRVSSAPSNLCVNTTDIRRQVSWDSRCLDSRDILRITPGQMMEPRIYENDQKQQHQEIFRSAKSTTSASTLHTSPTDDLSFDEKDGESAGLEIVPERKTMEVKLFVVRLPIFHKRRRNVNLKRARGCLT